MPKAKPKLDWLPEAQASLNQDRAFRKLGSTDMKLALVIGETARLVRFEAFEIAAVEDLDLTNLRDADLVLTMSAREWNAYLRKRRNGSGPTLLSLDLQGPQRLISAQSPLQRLMFERYNLSIQAFIDKGAELPA